MKTTHVWVLMLGALLGGDAEAWQQAAQTDTAKPTVAAACPSALQPYIKTTLYFERPGSLTKPGQRKWQAFIREVLLQHLPDGGTILDNVGWWRDPDGKVAGGRGNTLIVLGPPDRAGDHRRAVATVVAEIKKRYQQQSVLWEESWVCAGF